MRPGHDELPRKRKRSVGPSGGEEMEDAWLALGWGDALWYGDMVGHTLPP